MLLLTRKIVQSVEQWFSKPKVRSSNLFFPVILFLKVVGFVSVHYILIAGLGVDTKTYFIAVTIIIAILTDIKIFS